MNVRTKILVTLVISTVMVSSVFRAAFPPLILVLFFLPPFWMLCLKKYRAAAVYLILYGLSMLYRSDIAVVNQAVPYIPNIVRMFLAIMHYMLPGFGMASILFTTTSMQDYMNGMNRMHIPMNFTIATSVLFRFMPTVRSERAGIKRAARMRGLFGMWALRHPVRSAGYALIPLLGCCARIGDELSMASLCRGLSSRKPRTVRPGDKLRIVDWAMIAASLSVLVFFVYTLLKHGAGSSL